MFKSDYVFMVKNQRGDFVGLFKNKNNAIESLPETLRNFPKEITRNVWEYGKNKGSRWMIMETRIIDSNDLSYTKPA